MRLATYSFLPWLRQGLAGHVTATDGDTSVQSRARVQVSLRVDADGVDGVPRSHPVDRAVELYGPGDVVGIDRSVIVRTDPRDWITDAEPSYLASIEFYDEDFPWRYTPAAPDGSRLRLRPWLALVVLEEEKEVADVRSFAERPLPAVEVLDPAALPDSAQLWAWAHVHVNTTLAGSGGELTSTDMAAVLPRLAAALGTNRDLAYSRIVCPRRLKPRTPYHALLVPVFETGRLAGLGLDPAGAPHATFGAWEGYDGKPAAAQLPVYHRWYFRTGTKGDFEHLVRLLQPRTVDARVGVRDVDVRRPGSELAGVAHLGGILKLGGALRVPREALSPEERAVAERYEEWDQSPPAPTPYPQPLQRDLAAFVNLADDYAGTPADQANAASGVTTSPDPLITAPLYGRWHALAQRLLEERDGTPVVPADGWVHGLNLDPRHRVAAGFGTRVVQAGQETFMEAAWGQVGDVIEANRRIREAQLARLVARGWWTAQLAAADPQRALTLTAPAHRHVLLRDVPTASGPDLGTATLRHRLSASVVPPALVSAPMRRAARPRARLARALAAAPAPPGPLLQRVDAGEVSAAPPVTTPPGLATSDDLADAVPPPEGLGSVLQRLLRRHPRLPGIVLVLALACLLLGLIPVALLLLALWQALRSVQAGLTRADVLRPGGRTVDAVDDLPRRPDFALVRPGEEIPPLREGGSDSPTAARLKDALRDWHRLSTASGVADRLPEPVSYGPSGLRALAEGTVEALDPAVTVPRRVLAAVRLPERVRAELVEDFGEVMAHPRIDTPMYEPLRDLSDELLLPNLNLIPQNTVTLLETNRAFIEAYLVGLNHEMARELLWREYPTDQRGSVFRQFWDVRGARAPSGLTPEQAAEALRDVPELHRWPRRNPLGAHNNRRPGRGAQQDAVLVIRGELLKKYPTAVIYAHRAEWGRTDGEIDPAQERTLVDLDPAEEADPPPATVRMPLYEARVHPDISFFGFDLTVEAARGGTGAPGDQDPGWFFCIRERPGEPRFGFDIERSGPVQTVNDLAWGDVGVAEGGFVPADALSTVTLAPLGPGDMEKTDQRADDVQVVPAPRSAARWAYLLFQSPVLVAVHAAEMLRQEEP